MARRDSGRAIRSRGRESTAGWTALYRYFELEIERPLLPQVERWYRNLQQRPAFGEHVMVPFGELRGRLDF
jgi:glutathione S-transferase